MPNSITDYRELVDKPYGRIFYDIIFAQINITNTKKLKILDFGAGFCLTANHYADSHDVTAFEPNREMLKYRLYTNNYTVIDDFTNITEIPDNTFDMVICHNVLEYVNNKSQILQEIARILNHGGALSIVKHNTFGRILASAVFEDSPANALKLLNGSSSAKTMFGNRMCYSNEWIRDELEVLDCSLVKTYGIRAFYGLSANNSAKYSDEWYKNMLDLEIQCSEIEEFRKIAFFNHLIFHKK